MSKLAQGIRGAREAVKAGRESRNMKYCPSCGSCNEGRKHTPGSTLIELFLWLLFIIPGLLYSLWRLSARKMVCAECGEPGIIPANSPRARRELTR